MSEWREMRLGALVDAAGGHIKTGPFGSQLHSHEYTTDTGGVPVVMPRDMVRGRVDQRSVSRVDRETAERLKAHRLAAGDVVLARRGDVGRSAFVEEDEAGWLCGTGSMRIHAPDRTVIVPRFLRYAFDEPCVSEWLIGQSVGSTMPNLNAKIVSGLPLRVPDPTTQRRIAGVLSAFDELIEINERRIGVLEDLARSLYREWFVRFRFPGHEDAFVGSARGEIPERWTVCRLDAIAAIVMGQSPRSEFYNEIGEGLPFHQGVADYGDLLPTHRKYCTLESRTADAMDLLCSVRAPVGRLNLADERLVIGRGLSAIRRVDHNQALLLEQLRSPLGEEDSLGSGTIFKAINKEQLGGLPIVEPTADIARAFELKARPMLDERVQRTLQNRQLAGTRDLLLPRLVTGRLNISDIDLGELLPAEAA